MTLEWISEGDNLPIIGNDVLVALPRPLGEFWDVRVGMLLARHEDVVPRPVRPGSQWSVDFYWDFGRAGRDIISLVTGNGWWASLAGLSLPPNARHENIRGYDCIVQVGDVFVPQGERAGKVGR